MSYTPEQIAEALNRADYFLSCDKPESLPETQRETWENRRDLVAIIEQQVAQTVRVSLDRNRLNVENWELRDRIAALEYNLGISTERARNYEMIAERNRDRVAALEAKADLVCAALVGAEKEIVALKQCHHCKHGDHRHAVDTRRCVNTIERRCQCEENPT